MAQQGPRAPRRIQWAAAAAFSTIIAVCAWPSHAADLGRNASDAARAQADKIRAITGASSSKTEVPSGDPCRLLTNNEVHKMFPKTAGIDGKTDHTRDDYGIVACIWDYPTGRVVVRVTLDATPGGAKDDIHMFTDSNPFKPAAGVRYEKVTGIGDEAIAAVEPFDSKQGRPNNIAVFLTQRGKQQVVIVSSDLPTEDRTAALKLLEDAGRTAMSRL